MDRNGLVNIIKQSPVVVVMIIGDGDADSGDSADSGDCIFRWIINPHLAHPSQLSHRALQSVTPSDQAEIY